MVEAAGDEVEVRQRRRRPRAAACVSSATSWTSSQARRSGSATSPASRPRRAMRIVTQPGRRAELLHVDLGLEVGRPEVAVDEARDVLVEPQPEQDVVARDRVRAPAPSACRRRPGRARSPLHLVRDAARDARRGRGGRRPGGAPRPAARTAPGRVEARLDPELDRGTGRAGVGLAGGGGRAAPLAPLPAGPTPPDSPTNGIPWRSTASRLIRRAAVFCSATSRT